MSTNSDDLAGWEIRELWNDDYLQRVVLPLLQLKPGARLLDVCCGTSSLILKLARVCPEVICTGVDNNPEAITAAKGDNQGLKNVTFKLGDAHDFGGSTMGRLCAVRPC